MSNNVHHLRGETEGSSVGLSKKNNNNEINEVLRAIQARQNNTIGEQREVIYKDSSNTQGTFHNPSELLESIQKIADKKLSQKWLQSKKGASVRALFSKERAEFISENIPFAVLISLSEEEIEEIRDMLTSYDMMSKEEKEDFSQKMKEKVSSNNYDTIVEQAPNVVGMNEEDSYVLAFIRRKIMKGSREGLYIYKVFCEQQWDNLRRHITDPSIPSQKDLSFNVIDKGTINKIKNRVIDFRRESAKLFIEICRREYKSL